MRLFKLGVYYPNYLRQFYDERPGLSAASYADQHTALIQDRVASSNFWSQALCRIGYETFDSIANAQPMQQQWAVEHGIPFDDNFVFNISCAQIRQFRPEVLLVADYSTFTAAFLDEVRANCPSVRLVVGWCGAPYHDVSVMRAWDIALSCIPEMVAEFRALGLNAHHVNHGFEPRILEQLRPRSKSTSPFTFLGSIVRAPRFHEEREGILLRLVQSTPLEIFSDVGVTAAPAARLSQLQRISDRTVRLAKRAGMTGAVLDKVPWLSAAMQRSGRAAHVPALPPQVVARARKALFGLNMFQKLRESDVTLNTHIDVSPRSASNMRLFEATGAGACLLTDWKENLNDLFAVDSEVVAYRNADEAIEKFRYLEAHPAERNAIAAAGQRRALRDHNFDCRAARIDEIIRGAPKRRSQNSASKE